MTVSAPPPPASTSGSASKPRAGSNARTGPTGASGETATAPRHRQHHPADDGGRAVQADRECGLGAGCPDRAHGGHIGRREVQQLRQGLRGQHQQCQRRQCSEDGQRDRLRLDGLLHLVMNGVQAADVEADGACRYVDLAVQRVLRPGQLALQRRDPGRSRAEPQAYPRELELPVQVPGGGRGRQEGTGHLVELVHEHGRLIRDRGDHKGRVPDHCGRLRQGSAG